MCERQGTHSVACTDLNITKLTKLRCELKMSIETEKEKTKCKRTPGTSCMGGVSYVLGVIGAAVYYISTATSFWMGFLGFLKALVWPAFLVYELLKYLNM